MPITRHLVRLKREKQKRVGQAYAYMLATLISLVVSCVSLDSTHQIQVKRERTYTGETDLCRLLAIV